LIRISSTFTNTVLLRAVWVSALLALLAPGVFGQLLPKTDNQFWNDVQLAAPVTKQVDFVVLGTLRLGRGMTHPVDERIGVAFAFKAGKYLTFQPSYLHIATQPIAGRRGLFENRLTFTTTVRFPVRKFTVGDRNQFERRLRGPLGDTTRYRNRLRIEHGIGPTKLNLRVFISDEVFYDWGPNAWVRNRFDVGLSKTFNKHFTGDFYYLRQNDGRSRPGDLNVLGIVWRLRS
jgi:Protein of unknown function (DUF2490)